MRKIYITSFALAVMSLLALASCVVVQPATTANQQPQQDGGMMGDGMMGGMMSGDMMDDMMGGGMMGGQGGGMMGDMMTDMMGMMSGMPMMGGMMGYYSGVPTPLSHDNAKAIAEQYLASINNPDLRIDEFEEYSHNFYVSLIEKSTGRGAIEIIIDR